jgi:hypothetical protein
LLALLAAFVLGVTGLAASVGYRLPLIQDPKELAGPVALGMLLVAAIAVIPVLGAVLWFLASFYAAGAVMVSRFGTRPPQAPSTQVSAVDTAKEPARAEVGSPGSVTPCSRVALPEITQG